VQCEIISDLLPHYTNDDYVLNKKLNFRTVNPNTKFVSTNKSCTGHQSVNRRANKKESVVHGNVTVMSSYTKYGHLPNVSTKQIFSTIRKAETVKILIL